MHRTEELRGSDGRPLLSEFELKNPVIGASGTFRLRAGV